jgi:hypothetical protein
VWPCLRRTSTVGGPLGPFGRGSQYAGGSHQGLLWSQGITGSMSRKGNCWDNAPMESFCRDAEEEARPSRALRLASGGAAERVRIHRSLLQPDAEAFGVGLCEPRTVFEEAAECSFGPHPQRQRRDLPSSPPSIGHHFAVRDRQPAPTKASPPRGLHTNLACPQQPITGAYKKGDVHLRHARHMTQPVYHHP